ncbi:putative beta-glucosidase [Helianthus annuus]|nr:putative beta-glucosidase [Helianthus annuus]
MSNFVRLLSLILIIIIIMVMNNNAYGVVDEYIRDDFPPRFVFGAGTSAYQVFDVMLALHFISIVFIINVCD